MLAHPSSLGGRGLVFSKMDLESRVPFTPNPNFMCGVVEGMSSTLILVKPRILSFVSLSF